MSIHEGLNPYLNEVGRRSIDDVVESLTGLQDQTVNLFPVLEVHRADHFHFGEPGPVNKRPLVLQPAIDKAIIERSCQYSKQNTDLWNAYANYFKDIGFSGQARIFFYKDNDIGEDIVPDKNGGFGASDIIKNFPMVDFSVQFEMLREIKEEREKDGRVFKRNSIPGLFINATQINPEEPFYKLDLASRGGIDIRTSDKLTHYLDTQTPYFINWRLGIKNNREALYLPDEHASLVEDLHAAKL